MNFTTITLSLAVLLTTGTTSPEHKLIAVKRSQIGFESKIKLTESITDNRDLVFEILHTDSTISFMTSVYPLDQEFSKGSEFMNHFFVADDTLSLHDRIGKAGTFKHLYPTSNSCLGNASIAFFAQIPPDSHEGFLLPDLTISSGVLHLGDTVNLKDHLGRQAIAKIEEIELQDQNGARINLPFLVPAFNRKTVAASVLYSTISGENLTEKIQLEKH